jgi:hypothetical protein
MLLMRCPECGTANPVSEDYCRACEAELWPEAQPQGTGRPGARSIPAPISLRMVARRFLRHLFRAS